MKISTPFLWVILPAIVAGISIVFNHRRKFSLILSSATSIGLSLLAAFFPEDFTISMSRFNLVFQDSLNVFGRKITLPYSILPFIAFVFGMTALWLLSSNLPGVPNIFKSIALIIPASLTAALGVEPFLYAALLIETTVLISIPMLMTEHEESHTGILRYLSLMTIGMPFILIAGWMMEGVVTLPPESPLVGQTAITLGLGFAIWLAVFPFHTWVPLVAQRSHPIATSFLLFILPASVLVFGLNFLNRYEFLRSSTEIFQIFRIIGAMMIVFGGVWVAAQDDLKKAFGFSAIVETGISLLALGLTASGGLHLMLMIIPARGVAYWLWGYVLSRMEEQCKDLNIKSLKGCAKKMPIASLGLLFSQLSIAGLPLLASFPIKTALFTKAFELNKNLGTLSFFGNLGLFLFSIRLLLNATANPEEGDYLHQFNIETRKEYLPVLLTILVLALCGLFPGTFLNWITNILEAFPQLQ